MKRVLVPSSSQLNIYNIGENIKFSPIYLYYKLLNIKHRNPY